MEIRIQQAVLLQRHWMRAETSPLGPSEPTGHPMCVFFWVFLIDHGLAAWFDLCSEGEWADHCVRYPLLQNNPDMAQIKFLLWCAQSRPDAVIFYKRSSFRKWMKSHCYSFKWDSPCTAVPIEQMLVCLLRHVKHQRNILNMRAPSLLKLYDSLPCGHCCVHGNVTWAVRAYHQSQEFKVCIDCT